MSKGRKIYTAAYLIFLVILLYPQFFPIPMPEKTPVESWNIFHRWLGEAPAQLEKTTFPTGMERSTYFGFTFPGSADKEKELVEFLELQESAEPLPEDWHMTAQPGATIFRQQPPLICLLAGNNEWGYVIEGTTLTRLADGRTLFAFKVHWEEDDTICGGNYYRPRFEKKDEESSFLIGIFSLLMLLSDFLLAPLGLLLLFPRFNLSRMRHYALWYSSVLILPIIMVVWCYPAWYSGPLLGVTIFGTLFLGIPLLLLGAWVCSRTAKPYLKATPPRNS